MKQEIKNGIISYTAEDFRDIDTLISDFNHLIKSGAVESLVTTRREDNGDYIETVIKYLPNQNWIE
jgi:hypothetical protein